jgi:AraC family transcriptional regulator
VSDHVGGVFHDPRAPLHDLDEMRVTDTHGIAQWSSHRLLLDSAGLGWHDAYMSLAVEAPWKATLPALPHCSLAYFVRSSARIHRQVEGSAVESVAMRPRQFGMIPSDRCSTWELEGSPEVELVYVRRDTLDSLVIDEFDADPGVLEIEPQLGFDDPLLEQLVHSMLETARHDRQIATAGLWADHLVRMIGLELLRHHSNLGRHRPAASDASPSRLDAAREYIEANLTGDLSLARIAQAVGLRSHRLAGEFRDHVGVTPHQYVITRRVERAARALRSSDESIALVAAESGFASQSHLTTAFRHRYGTTPAAYRASR